MNSKYRLSTYIVVKRGLLVMLMEFVSEDLFQRCDLDSPISSSTCVDCDEFQSYYINAAKASEEKGNLDQALVYRFFGAICGFHFRPDDKIEPFSNKVGFSDGTRTLVGSDFDKKQLSALATIIPKIENLALRTRVADLVWSGDKSQADLGRLAVEGYVSLVKALISGDATERFHEPDPTGIAAADFLNRAMNIAYSLGWKKESHNDLRSTLFEVMKIAMTKDDMAIVRIASLCIESRINSAEKLLDSLNSKVDELLEKPDFFVAESVQRLIIRRAQIAKNDTLIHDATIKLTGIFELKANTLSNAMLKSHALQQAIESLQGLKGVRDDRQRIHDKLKEAQLHMSDEFGKIEHSTDLTSEVKRLMAGYDGLELLDCLSRLAQSELPRDPEELIKSAQNEAQKYPLSSLFSTSLVDRKGRTVAHTGGGIDNNDTLRYKVIQSEKIRIGLGVAAAINPARQLITEKFTINYSVLYELCVISPFVPDGTEHAFARGLQAFLYGDDFLAVVTLVPLLEAGLRQLVVIFGRSDTKISAGGIEAAVGLGPMLSDHRDVLEKVFGKSIVFAIENLFVHELGPKIRHSHCHGMTTDSEYFSHEHIYASKLILSLVMLPMLGENWEAHKHYIQSKIGDK